MKTAVITGIRGQDASYLADFLLEKDYRVVGIERRTSAPDYSNIQHLLTNKNLVIEQGDITDSGSLNRVLRDWRPDEFYNLAAQSFVGGSWDQPLATCQINFDGVCNCLESIRLSSSNTKFFQASTSEVYGDVLTKTQNEETPARPRSPYAASKYGAESLVKVYRDSYDMFACFARSFNHESPRRGPQFVTRKITMALADMMNKVEEYVLGLPVTGERFYSMEESFELALEKGIIEPIRLGNLDAKRDWSDTKDIVRGMWLMMQQDEPKDYVMASGKARSIREFLDAAFGIMDITDWSHYVVSDPKFYRPAEVNCLCGDYSKIKEELGWEPEIPFEGLVYDMVHSDVQRSSRLQHSRV